MVVFHKKLRERLMRQIAHDRFPHTLLLVGPRGIGKCTLARWCAQALVCESLTRGAPCNSCAACRAVLQGTHPDVIGISEERSLASVTIEEWRARHNHLTRTPLRASRTVTIVPDCKRFTLAAQHACLKSLEEPRSTAVLVLTATSDANLLPTLLSRAAILRLHPVPKAELRSALKQSGANLLAHTIEELLQIARGIPGKIMREGNLRLEALEQWERFQRIVSVKGKPLWAAQKTVREVLNKEDAHETMRALIASVIRREKHDASFSAPRHLCITLASALTHSVNKELALDALSLSLSLSRS